jgi:pilus assembly protein Flp/PilA
MCTFSRLRNDEQGATAIEYGLLLAMIAIVLLGVLSSLGFTLEGVFDTASSAMAVT